MLPSRAWRSGRLSARIRCRSCDRQYLVGRIVSVRVRWGALPDRRCDRVGPRHTRRRLRHRAAALVRRTATPPSPPTTGTPSPTQNFAERRRGVVQRGDPGAGLVDCAPSVWIDERRLAPQFFEPGRVPEPVPNPGLDLRIPSAEPGQAFVIRDGQRDVSKRFVSRVDVHLAWLRRQVARAPAIVDGLGRRRGHLGRPRTPRRGGLARRGAPWRDRAGRRRGRPGPRCLFAAATPGPELVSTRTTRVWGRRGFHLQNLVPIESQRRVALLDRPDDVWRERGTPDLHVGRTAKPVEHPQLRRTTAAPEGVAQIGALVSARVAGKS